MTTDTDKKKHSNKVNYADKRTFLWLGELKKKLNDMVMIDPRFKSVSAFARHIIPLGIKADEADRRKALKGIK